LEGFEVALRAKAAHGGSMHKDVCGEKRISQKDGGSCVESNRERGGKERVAKTRQDGDGDVSILNGFIM
jgi:hypothetical protein